VAPWLCRPVGSPISRPRGLAALWGIALALAGGRLLLRLLNYQPVTRRAFLHATWNFVAIGCWGTFCSGPWGAYERGLISPPMSIFAVIALFALLTGISVLIGLWYPEKEP